MQQLKHDAQGFLIGNGAVKASAEEGRMLRRIADDVRAMRRIIEQRDSDGGRSDGKPAQSLQSAGSSAIGIASPQSRSSVSIGTSGSLARIAKAAEGRPVVALPRRSANDEAAKGLGKSVASEIRTGLSTQANAGRKDSASGAYGAGAGRDSLGRFESASKVPTATPQLDGGRNDGTRDVRGRFTVSGRDGSDENSAVSGAVRKAIDALSDKVGGLVTAAGDAGEIDPSVKAASEVGDLASKALAGVKTVGSAAVAVAKPMGRGMASLFGTKPSDAPTPWFRRFFAEMRGFRREQSAFNKAELRVLKGIEAKDENGKRGGLMGLVGMLLGPLVAAIGAAIASGFGMLGKLPGLGALSKMAAAMGSRALITQPTTGGVATAPSKKPGLLSRIGKGAGGALKRVPLLGAALAAIGMGAGVYDSETDGNLSRADKDKKTGGVLGGGGGAIAGMLTGGAAGLKLGAVLGAIGGPIGIAIGGAIGGVVGSVAGGFFGEKAGAIVGETVGGWVTDVRNADIPGMIGRAWEKTTAAVLQVWTDSTDWVGKKWDAALTGFSEMWAGAKSVFADFAAGADAIVAKFGIDLPAIREKLAAAAEAAKAAVANGAQAAAQWAKEKADAAKNAVQSGATTAANAVSEKAGQANEALKNSMVGKGVSFLFSGGKRKAAETAQSYAAGNIAGLDDAHTRALVASTALTESGGGQLDAVNKQGYMGRYQAGAAWLANAGLIAGGHGAVQAAMKADGFKSEWKWAEAGGMTRFLSNNANWAGGNSRAKYLASAEIQDQAFKVNGDKTYADLVRRGVIKPGDSPLAVAGYLKAAHIGGAGGAVAVSQGKTGASDANGTSARKYFEDVVHDKDGFVGAFRSASSIAVPVVVSTAPAITTPPSPQVPKVQDLPTVNGAAGSASGLHEDKKPQVVVIGGNALVGRDLAERRIAHIATGGIAS